MKLHERFLRIFIRKRNAFRAVGETEAGRNAIAVIREFCRPDDSPFVDGDPHATARNIGMQDVWRMIEGNLAADLTDDALRDRALKMERELREGATEQ